MDIKQFVEIFREAFGERQLLPIAMWYSDEPVAQTAMVGGCYFKHLESIRAGVTVSLNEENIGCNGGKFYAGFSAMPEYVPTFVSEKEHYKESAQAVLNFVESVGVERKSGKFLNLTLLDNLDSFDDVEGLLFLCNGDVLSGLASWCFYDGHTPDAISTLFGSGCSTIITQTINENKRGGHRCFIGLFDPSARPFVNENELAMTIPFSRFKEMYATISKSCLIGTRAWGKVLERING